MPMAKQIFIYLFFLLSAASHYAIDLQKYIYVCLVCVCDRRYIFFLFLLQLLPIWYAFCQILMVSKWLFNWQNEIPYWEDMCVRLDAVNWIHTHRHTKFGFSLASLVPLLTLLCRNVCGSRRSFLFLRFHTNYGQTTRSEVFSTVYPAWCISVRSCVCVCVYWIPHRALIVADSD